MSTTETSTGHSAEDYIKSEAQRKLEEASAIAEKASSESRAMTSDERKQAQTLLEDVSNLQIRVKEMKESTELKNLIDGMNANLTAPVTPAPEQAKSVGDAVVLSDAFQALKSKGFSGRWTTGPIELKGFNVHSGSRADGSKAVVSTTASPIVVPDYQEGILPTLFQRLTILDLLSTGTTDSNQVTYAQETTATNAADSVAEEGTKPESTIVLELVNEAVRKVATFLPVSDEMLDDVSQARSYLDSRLRLFVQLSMEDQLLNGGGTPPDLRGLLNRTGIDAFSTVTPLSGQKIIDAVYQAITNIRTGSFLEPDGVVVNPTDWALVRLATDDNSQYYGGGPFMGPYGNGGIASDNIWNLPVVVTQAIAQGTVLVGAFRSAAQAFLKGGLTVEASNSHADFFQKDMTALRAEQRAALAVYRPAAFSAITLTA